MNIIIYIATATIIIFLLLRKINYNKNKIIVSLTTSPRRIYFMKKVIDSILNQTLKPDLIRINIPKIHKRSNQTYKIPIFILNNPKIKIYTYDEDLGPIKKILPSIIEEKNATIIYTDDDVLMLPKTIEIFMNYASNDPYYVYCLSGFNYNRNLSWNINKNLFSEFVNIPEGYMSVCLSSSLIKQISKKLLSKYYNLCKKNEFCFTSDDLILGNFFAMNNIKIIRIHEEDTNFYEWWYSGCELSYGKDGDGIQHISNDEHYSRYNNAYDFLKLNNINYL